MNYNFNIYGITFYVHFNGNTIPTLLFCAETIKQAIS